MVWPAIALSPSLQVLVEEGDRALNRALPLALECVALTSVSDECDIFAGGLQCLDRRFRPADWAGVVCSAMVDQHRLSDPIEVGPRRRCAPESWRLVRQAVRPGNQAVGSRPIFRRPIELLPV